MSDIVDLKKMAAGWVGGLPETPCGYGSKLSTTEAQREWIPKMVRKYKVKTVADIGAGDLNWVQHVKWPKGVEYTAYDLIPRKEEVTKFDLLAEIPPQVDLIMCLWVLNHFDFENCRKAIQNLKASGATYLLMTDRPIWHREQPPEIVMPALETLVLNEKQDRLILACLS